MEVVVLSTQELNNRGVELCVTGDYERGIQLLRKAQASEPDDPDLCCSLANALAEHKDYEEALFYLRHALSVDSEHPAASALLTNVQFELKEQNRPPHVPYKPQMIPPTSPPRQALHVAEPYPEPTTRSRARVYSLPWLTFFIFSFLAVSCAYALWLVVHPPDYFPPTERTAIYPFIVDKVEDDTPDNRVGMEDNVSDVQDTTVLPTKVAPNTRIFQYNCVNKTGTSVGVITVNGLIRAFTLKGKSAQFLNPLPNDFASCAESINESGTIVGYSIGAKQRAVVWKNGNAIDLNTQIPEGSGLVLLDALSIDDAGIIVVSATDLKGAAKLARLVPV